MSEARTAKTVLIIDDDPAYRQVLTMALNASGYRATAAENGARALPIVSNSPPDIILLDMLMPVMDGLQFLRWVKQEAKVSIPIVVLTCMDSRSVVVDALLAGATDVITKPFSLPILIRKLSTLA